MSMIGASYFDNSVTWYIMEVREDALVLKTKRGDMVEHCPYEGIVNMTFSPKTKIICIWRRSEGLTQLRKYHTKKVIKNGTNDNNIFCYFLVNSCCIDMYL